MCRFLLAIFGKKIGHRYPCLKSKCMIYNREDGESDKHNGLLALLLPMK